MTHYEIASRFVRTCLGKPGLGWRGRKSSSIRGDLDIIGQPDTLYSYGAHFPLLQWRPEVGAFLMNGDHATISTSRHQREIWGVADAHREEAPLLTVARSACPFDPFAPDTARIVGFWPDTTIRGEVPEGDPIPHEEKLGWTVSQTTEWQQWDAREGVYVNREQPVVKWTAHRPASLLFHVTDNTHAVPTYYLSGMDEGSYFVCEMPARWAPRADADPDEVMSAAFSALEPRAVRDVRKGVALRLPLHFAPIRQGEWYFIPQPPEFRPSGPARIRKQVALDVEPAINRGVAPGRNSHVVTHLCYDDHGRAFARGRCIHRAFDGSPSRQHRTVKLGATWHRVVRNTAGRGWNGEGQVD